MASSAALAEPCHLWSRQLYLWAILLFQFFVHRQAEQLLLALQPLEFLEAPMKPAWVAARRLALYPALALVARFQLERALLELAGVPLARQQLALRVVARAEFAELVEVFAVAPALVVAPALAATLVDWVALVRADHQHRFL